MRDSTIVQLVDELKQGKVSRRGFLVRATALGLSVSAASGVLSAVAAQDATPGASPEASPAASPIAYDGPVGTISVSREDYNAALRETFAFEEPTQTGGTLIQVESTDIVTTNALLPSDVYSSLILLLFNDALVASSPIDGSYVPGLADSWEIAADGRTYTFHLHEGVTWHDGTPFTADDVVFSYDATFAEDSQSIRRADVLSVLESYRKIDDLTVEFTAKAPIATFFDKTVNQVGIVPKHIWESVPFAEWASDPGSTGTDPSRVIGTGPFKFVEWVQNDHVTLAKNPDYWDKENIPVYIDEFIYRIVADPNAALQSFIIGETDVFASIEPAQAETLKSGSPEIKLSEFDNFNFTFFAPNEDPGKTPLFTDIGVRQALLYSLDRDLIAETIYLGYAIRADGTQPVPSPAYAPDRLNTIYNYDPEKAKQLIAAAGWVDSDGDGIVEKDGIKFSFECEYPDSVAAYEQQLPYMQEAWKAIGLEMIPTKIPFPTLVDHVTSNNFVMGVIGFSWGVDPDQGPMFRTDAKPPAGFNLTAYSNPEYDRLNDAQNLELDPAKRIELIIEQSNIINDEAATGVTVFQKSIAGSGARVHNFYANAYGYGWSYAFTWFDS